jgi:hypothetical protein
VRVVLFYGVDIGEFSEKNGILRLLVMEDNEGFQKLMKIN